MVKFSEEPTSWKIIWEPMTGNVIKSEVDALMYVVLSKAEKTRDFWGNKFVPQNV
jgi:hypothetical protein